MMKSAKYLAGALALAVGLGLGVAHAGGEAVSVSAEGGLAQAFTQVRASIGSKLSKLAKAQAAKKAPAGLYGRDHCSPYDDTMVPAYESEVGYYCKSRNPASVSCEIVGWQTVPEGEGGPVTRPVLGNCNPRGGFAGTPLEQAPQAP